MGCGRNVHRVRPYRKGEIPLAKDFVESIPNHSVTLLEKVFSALIWWEIELGFRDIKSAMQDNALTLRSKTVDLVCQELWGLFRPRWRQC